MGITAFELPPPSQVDPPPPPYSRGAYLPFEEVPCPYYTLSSEYSFRPLVIPRKHNNHPAISDRPPPSRSIVHCILILTETTRLFRGELYTPFCRAYSPILIRRGICKSTFLNFLDALSNAFLASPVLKAAGFQDLGLNAEPIHPVQWADIGMQVSAGSMSVGVSIDRATSCVASANEQLFAPAGLQATILSTQEMASKIGFLIDNTPMRSSISMDDFSRAAIGQCLRGMTGLSSSDTDGLNRDPRMQLLRAMDGYVEPLSIESEPLPLPDNMFKRMSVKQARKKGVKQNEKLLKEKEKAAHELRQKTEAADAERQRREEEAARFDTAMASTRANAKNRLAKAPNPQTVANIERDLSREMARLGLEKSKSARKIGRKVDGKVRESDETRREYEQKELEITQRVMWVVITAVERQSR